MRQKLCNFFSTSTGLGVAVVIVLNMLPPYEGWWLRLIVAAILTPIAVLAANRFYGVQQIWDWKCSKDKRKKHDRD